VRFDENDIRTMGRVARGVTGIRFKAGDGVVGMEVVDPQSEILTVTRRATASAPRSRSTGCRAAAGRGRSTSRSPRRTAPVVGILQVREEDEVMVVTKDGKTIRTAVKGINRIGRATQASSS